MAQGKERRKWPRLEAAFRVRLRALEGEGEVPESGYLYTKNISTGGLLIESGGELGLTKGSVFEVEIAMPLAKYGFGSQRRLEARGRVCRVEEPGEGGGGGVALEFMAPPRFVNS